MEEIGCDLTPIPATACLMELWVRIPLGSCISLVSVVYLQVAVSASGWSLVQLSLRVCVSDERDREASTIRGFWLITGCCAKVGGGEEYIYIYIYIYIYQFMHRQSEGKNVKTLKQYFGRDSNQTPQNIKMQARSFITIAHMHSNLSSNT